jgi:hypothetical protein
MSPGLIDGRLILIHAEGSVVKDGDLIGHTSEHVWITMISLGSRAGLKVGRYHADERSRILIDQAFTNHIMSQFGIIFHFHLFEDARSICADRFHAERQLVGDFLDGLSQRNHTQHFILPV